MDIKLSNTTILAHTDSLIKKVNQHGIKAN